MKKKEYTSNERTIAQFHAMELKKHGYQVTRLIETDPSGDPITIAFGYNPSSTTTVKEVVTKYANMESEESYEFIYWN